MMIKIHQGNEEINSNGGNILIGKLISDIGLEKMNLQTTKRIKHGEIPHSDLVKMAVTLLGLESLPSGKFATNALILNLATLAYNCLRFIGQEALSCSNLLSVEIKVSRRRLRSGLQDMIYVGCKLVRHANTLILKFGRNCPWFQCIGAVYARC